MAVYHGIVRIIATKEVVQRTTDLPMATYAAAYHTALARLNEFEEQNLGARGFFEAVAVTPEELRRMKVFK